MAQASGRSAGKSFFGRFGVHIAVFIFVAIWTIPTLGILVSSLRDKDQIIGVRLVDVLRQFHADGGRPPAAA